jgi:hypothetical protein
LVPDVKTICRLARVLSKQSVELFGIVAGEKVAKSHAPSSTDKFEIAR